MTAKDLKASILQLAIQGKLVPQDPNDEPAEVLLARIRDGLPAALTQRTQRTQRGAKTSDTLRSSANFAFSASAPAGKNPVNPVKKYPPVTDDEKPFDLPATWTWCRLGEIAEMIGTKRYQIRESAILKSGKFPVVSQGQKLVDGYCDDASKVYGCDEMVGADLRAARNRSANGFSLDSDCGAPGGRALPVLLFGDHTRNVKYIDFPFVVGADGTKLFRSLVSPRWTYFWSLYATLVLIPSRGYGRHWKIFSNLPIPLPPLAEQKRIVAKIEELMPMVERYAAAKAESDELEANLPDAFRKSVLQQAVEGKLVPQDPNDEPAEALLARIRDGLPAALTQRAQRAQRGAKSSDSLRSSANFAFSASAPAGKNPVNPVKKYPPVTDDEKPFDLPANWTWCRLGEIVFNHGQKTPESQFSYIDIGSIDNKRQRLNEQETLLMPKEASSRARKIVKKGDIIYSCVRPYLHNMAIIDSDFSREPIASTGFAVMATMEAVDTKYLFYFLLSPVFDDYANNTDNAKGVAYPAISDAKLYKAVIPLPPLAEQKRIVAKVEELLDMGEKLRVQG